MFQPENLSLFILLGIVIVFVGIILLPVDIVVEEEKCHGDTEAQ